AVIADFAAHTRRIAHIPQAHARALFNAERLDAVLARIVLGGENRGLKILAQLALGLGHAALRFLLGFAPVRTLSHFRDGFLGLLLEAGQRLIGAALQFFQLRRFALLPVARDFLFTPLQLRHLFAQALLQRLSFFNAVVQFAEKSRDVALAVAHGKTRAPHDVL